MLSHHRLFAITLLFVVLAATLAPASAKTPVAHLNAPAKTTRAGARTASVASSPAIEYIDSFGGTISTFAISGTLAFLLQGSALTVLDISAPAAPRRIGYMPLLSGASMLTIADGIAYVANYRNMQIVDVHNPALPVELARFQARDYVTQIQVVGTLAYLSEVSDGVEIVDVSDASRPFPIAQYPQLVFSGRFLVIGNLAYFINFSAVLTILDISNPSAPITRGTFTLSALGLTSFGSMVVEGNRTYINAFTRVPAGLQQRLVTLDTTHPESPLLLGDVEFPARLIAVAGNTAYAASNSQLLIFNVSNPAQLVARGVYPGTLTQEIGATVQADGNRAYLVEDQAAFKILDISNPDNLALLGSYSTLPGLKSPISIQVAGSTGYVLNRGLQIIDLTSPISPTLRGFYPSELAFFAQVVGSHAYIHNSSSGLDLLDISNPDLPTRITTLRINSVQAVTEANNWAYIMTTSSRECGKYCIIIHNMLNIFDISTPSTPVLAGHTLLFDSSLPDTSSIVVKGSLAYVAGSGALRIVDISLPAMPVVQVTYPLAGDGDRMQIVGNLAYVATTEGLMILDVTDPLKPSLLGQTGSWQYPYSLQVQGGLAFVGGTAGVRVVDISDPSRPIPRAADGERNGQLGVLGDIIYVAAGAAGLSVLRLHADRFPPPMFVPLARH